MAEREGLLKRLGRGFDRYVGGLLGEDISTMTPEEKAAARRSIIGVIGRGMVDPGAGSTALGNVVAARAAQRKQGEMERREQAAEQEAARVSARLFGGQQVIEGLQPGDEPTPVGATVTPYGQRSALQSLISTRAGRDAAELYPNLLPAAQSMYAPKEKEYVYQNVPDVGLVAVNKKDPSDSVLVQSVGQRPQQISNEFKILTPAEAAAEGLPSGFVYQRNLRTKEVSPIQGISQAGQLDATSERQYRTAKIGIQNARDQILNLNKSLQEVPAYKAIAGAGRGQLEASYSLALSAIRQLQNSGVLNVGELPFLSKALNDPTTIGSILSSPLQRRQLDQQINIVLGLLDQQERVVDYSYGKTPEMGPPRTSGPQSRGRGRAAAAPVSAEAINRSEGYYD